MRMLSMTPAIISIVAPLPQRSGLSPLTNIGLAIPLLIIFLLGLLALAMMIRKVLHSHSSATPEAWQTPAPDTENASAFMAASMQGVIEKLRAQEKELARLHTLAQERAQESERLTEEVTRNMPTGLLLVSATGAISTSNPAAEEALGIRPLRYRSYKEILGADSDLTQMLSLCLSEGKTIQRGEVEHLTPHGEARRLGVTISPIYRPVRNVLRNSNEASLQAPKPGSDMKISGALCLMSDLTELTALQKQIRWKENLAALGEMSAGIAHEFKNALATISGYAQMIRSESRPGDVRESAERILDQTRSLTHVVTEFLRFAKPLEICYETVPMKAVVERVAEELREAIPHCSVEFEGTFEELPGDEALLRQALVNLVRNGAEAARQSGKAPHVTLSGTVEDLGGRKWQRVSIADNGPGIPEKDLPKIFLPFFTTKSDGTGLGLAVVQKVALQHGGSIEARNRQGGGAEFLLWLPLRQEPSPSLFPSEAIRI
ncbi:MAG TPA: ATP-binding protein [Candidatus Acidoferrales bacterium]|nr:ATP-binding protein [Candidatus Acidoferrales bacterium]